MPDSFEKISLVNNIKGILKMFIDDLNKSCGIEDKEIAVNLRYQPTIYEWRVS